MVILLSVNNFTYLSIRVFIVCFKYFIYFYWGGKPVP